MGKLVMLLGMRCGGNIASSPFISFERSNTRINGSSI